MITAELTARDGTWQVDPGFGIYVHIPFCLHRCNYCDFNTYEGLDALRAPYVDALVAEIARSDHGRRTATSVFFGGGTPTLLGPAQLGRVLDAIDARFGIAAGAEVTAEANPETVDVTYLRELRAAGFNRISIGIQSLAPNVLARLGRTHTADVALEALRAARAAGFEDFNADLIYGSPWERAEDWERSLAGITDIEPDHVSAYALTVESDTPLHTLVASGRVPDVDPDVQAERHIVAVETLAAAGYGRYEVSNWAKPGRASRHNVLYWSAGDYVGFGAGAHSHFGGRRWWSTRLPRDYVSNVREGRSTTAGEETLDADARAGEALMLGLRLVSGIERAGFENRFGPDALGRRAGELRTLEAEGLIRQSGGYIRLTDRGTSLGNDVAARLL